MRLHALALIVLAVACRADAETRDAQPADELGAAISACAPGPPARGRAAVVRVLRAWTEGAELPPTDPIAPRPPVDDALVARGRALYGADCASCHGAQGAGDGPRARGLERAPTDLTSGTFALRSTESGELPTDLDLFTTITRGVHGTAMAPWFALPERDRWALVAYVKALSPSFADDAAPPPIAIGLPPPSTPELAARGAALFHERGCASCHGERGTGDGPAAAALHLASGAPAHPRDLTGNRFHRGSDVRAIFQTITTGLDGTPMASFAKVMSEDDRWAVATWVHGLSAPYAARPDGLRCPTKPGASADELVGVRDALRALSAPAR